MGRMDRVAVIPAWLSDAQETALRRYQGGAFAHLLEIETERAFQQAIVSSNDPVLKLLMTELASSDGAVGLEECITRVNAAADALRVVADGLAGRLFDDFAA